MFGFCCNFATSRVSERTIETQGIRLRIVGNKFQFPIVRANRVLRTTLWYEQLHVSTNRTANPTVTNWTLPRWELNPGFSCIRHQGGRRFSRFQFAAAVKKKGAAEGRSLPEFVDQLDQKAKDSPTLALLALEVSSLLSAVTAPITLLGTEPKPATTEAPPPRSCVRLMP